VDEWCATVHELVDAEAMPLVSNFIEIPDGMVEDDEDVWQGVEFGEYLLESGRRRCSRELREGKLHADSVAVGRL